MSAAHFTLRRARPGSGADLARIVAWALVGLFCVSARAAQPQPVSVPSLDRPSGAAVLLPAYWFAAPGAAPAPALVMFHGCGGLYDERGRLASRYIELAARLNALGIHALATDSFTPRGERQICTQLDGARRITMTQRRRDALGALQWLAVQPGVDAARLGLLGWSNGGSTVLAATNSRHPEVQAAAVHPSLAVAFYPGCETDLRRGYAPTAPLLMLLGEADDWTPAAPCKALAAAAGPAVQWEAYAGAYHGFDGTAPVRLRRDVPNGAQPGQGVHVGADPVARSAAEQRLASFLRQQWSLTP
jgi:dienelactone hydrolase